MIWNYFTGKPHILWTQSRNQQQVHQCNHHHYHHHGCCHCHHHYLRPHHHQLHNNSPCCQHQCQLRLCQPLCRTHRHGSIFPDDDHVLPAGPVHSQLAVHPGLGTAPVGQAPAVHKVFGGQCEDQCPAAHPAVSYAASSTYASCRCVGVAGHPGTDQRLQWYRHYWHWLSLCKMSGLKQNVCCVKSALSGLLSADMILVTWQAP